jgi:hypothetical protein
MVSLAVDAGKQTSFPNMISLFIIIVGNDSGPQHTIAVGSELASDLDVTSNA